MTHATVAVQAEGGEVEIVLSGEIDLDNAAAVESQIHDAISNQTTRVRLLVSEVGYIDSIGLRILFALTSTLAGLGIDLTVVAAPRSAARRVIELSGLASVASLQP